MIIEKTQKIIKEIEQGKSLSEIARENGVSRQRVHEIKTKIGKYKVCTPKKDKKPSKRELKAQLVAEAREKAKLQAEVDELKQREWNERLPRAYEECRRQLKMIFPNLIEMLHFEHVDVGGFWFTFRLVNDPTVQTYSVRHSDF